jgi:hypothetical protein
LDEAWVAVSTRAPLGRLPEVTSSTPIGLTFLIRLVPGNGHETQRLVPLLFAALAVLAAYAFGSTLRTLPVITGLLTGGAALLVPAMLARDDLKEYTADAFAVLLIFAMLSRVEASWSRRRLLWLGLVLVALALISHIALLVAAVALPCLALTRLAQRRWNELAEVLIATAATGAVLLGIFVVFDRGTGTTSLRNYWNGYYIPHTPSAALQYIHTGLHRLLPYLGIGNVALLTALVAAGIVVLAWQGRWATAALLPLLIVELIVLSGLRRYPLLDERTSTFLMTAAIVVAAVGVAGLATVLARRVHLAAGIVVAATCAALYIPGTIGFVRSHPIPPEDVRDQAAYVAAHVRPGDVVLVSLGASYGYGYYAPPRPQLVKSGGIGISVTYPAGDRIVALTNRRPIDVRTGLSQALHLLAGHPGARLWIVLAHLNASEAASWNSDLAPLAVKLVPVAPQTSLRYVQQ